MQIDNNHTQVLPLPLGVIEGFYGKPWSWQTRLDYALFLKNTDYQLYIYAPKSDAYLRSQWYKPWPDFELESLACLGAEYHLHGLRWGIGLSPLNLFQNWNPKNRDLLTNKLSLINQLGPDLLCILFDDMNGCIHDLATIQLEIVHFIAEKSTATSLMVCPTYYSNDPVLQNLFGSMPDGYWSELGKGLADDIQLFWTGSKVCSNGYTKNELDEIAEQFQRSPTLWDNYPVNDGKLTSNFLNIDAFRNRPADIAGSIRSHIVNPMNAANLSRIPLITLQDSYHFGKSYDPDKSRCAALAQVCGTELGKQIEQDLGLFKCQGLVSLEFEIKMNLIEQYANYSHPCAEEITAWLQGEYKFDPSCLTS